MPNTADGEGRERRIRDMLGLVKFCLESTKSEDAPGGSSSFGAMDPDRRAWLQNAIESMTVDTTKQLLENLATVKEAILEMKKDPRCISRGHDVLVRKTCDAIGILTDLCEEIDYAADFAKLDGFSIFEPLIRCSQEELIVKACELIAALAQNNPICQHMALQTRLLERLLDFAAIKEDQSYIKARSYALYAISSIVRSNQDVRGHFESHLDGLDVVLSILGHQIPESMLNSNETSAKMGDQDNKTTSRYWWRKLKIRSIFLFRTLCDESQKSSDVFYRKQAITHLSNQLSITQDLEIREHLLNALKSFLLSMDKSRQIESVKASPQLRDIIKKIHQASSQESGDEYDLTDTRSVCKELLELIGSLHTESESSSN